MVKIHNQKRISHLVGQRFYGLLIVFASFALFFIIAVFFTHKIQNRVELPKYLPEKDTIGFIEFNLNQNIQDQTALKTLISQNFYTSTFLQNILSLIPDIDSFNNWFAQKGGLAFLNNNTKHQLNFALFLKYNNKDLVLNWLDNLRLDSDTDLLLSEDYLGQKLYSFKKGLAYQILLTKNYLVISDDLNQLKLIARTIENQEKSLWKNKDFSDILSAMNDQDLAFIYVNRLKLLDNLSKNNLFLAQKLDLFKLYLPFLSIYSADSYSVQFQRQNNKLIIESLSKFNIDNFPTKDFFATDYFYQGILEKYLPENTLAQFGGINLLDQKNKLQAYFSNKSTVYDLFFTGVLNNLKSFLQDNYTSIDLDQDFFPLFAKEYLFAVTGKEDNKLDFNLILNTSFPERDLNNLTKIFLAIIPKYLNQVEAKPVKIVLPDGTEGQELKADLPVPQIKEILINNLPAKEIIFSNSFQIYLLPEIDKDLLFISTSQNQLELALKGNNNTKNLTQSLSKATEKYYLNFNQIEKYWPEVVVLKPIQSITIARKFTEIGLLSSYELSF